MHGLDLSRPLGDAVVAEVRAALGAHLVLFFPDQDLAPDVQADFARQFGEVTPAHPVIPALEGNPAVLNIDGREDRAAWWHTDVTFLQTPPLGSILHIREAPVVGGDTMWVSLQAAYDRAGATGAGHVRPARRVAPRPVVRGGRRRAGRLRVGRRASRQALPRLAPGGADPPRDRAQRVVRQLAVHAVPGGDVQARERLVARHALPPLPAPRVQLPLPLGARWRRLLGQPRHDALRTGRLRRRAPHRASRATLRGDRPYGPARPLRS